MDAPPSSHDGNLLFGILAFQLDFVNQQQLVDAMQAWLLEKGRPVADIMLERGWLSPPRHKLLSELVAEHVRHHDDDPRRSLLAADPSAELCDQLSWLGDPDLSRQLSVIRTHVDGSTHRDSVGTHVAGTRTRASIDLRFSVLRPLAEGGLGIVSVANDAELTREVALKEIKPMFADHTNNRARFLQEAEITGRLEHPGIVPVYGLGTYADGRPYYAMRMIRGRSLHAAITEFHGRSAQAAHETERRLALRELLQRFIDVCNTVEYAHSRGILHRDLKPANIMLGKFRETLVVDWGLAKPIDEVSLATSQDETAIVPELGGDSTPTRVGEVVGTVAFMSPEQAQGRHQDVGPASDVYSLGATLYHLLTGQVSQQEREFGKAIQAVCQGQFPRPRDVQPDVPRALEAICLRAMALRPADRYVSAAEFAEDIENYLADEPVLAHAETIWGRSRRWLRKHPRIFASLSATVVVGFVMASAVAEYVRRTNQQLQADKALLDEQNQQLDRQNAELTEQRTAAEVARKRAEAVKNVMVNAFRSPDPYWDGHQVTIFQVLDNVVRDLKTRRGDERTQADLLEAIGRSYLGLGLYEEALPVLEASRSILDKLCGPHDPATLEAMNDLAKAYHFTEQLAKAETLYQTVLAARRRLLGERNPDTLTSLNNLAAFYADTRQYQQALPLMQQAVSRKREILGPHELSTIASTVNLALTLQAMGRSEEAKSLYERELESMQQELGLSDTRTMSFMNNFASWYYQSNQLDEARRRFRECLALRREKLGLEHPQTIESMINLAKCLQAVGRLDEAAALGEEALRTSHATQGASDRTARRVLKMQSSIRLQRREYDAALDLSHRWRAALDQERFAQLRERVACQVSVADSLLGLGRDAEAAAEARAALRQMNELVAADREERLRAESVLAYSLLGQGKAEASGRQLIRAATELGNQLSSWPPHVRWYAIRAAERVLEWQRQRADSSDVAAWEATVKRLQREIDELRQSATLPVQPSEE